mmetsp:Transcript_8516/g.23007  ORF Transcript_8516/g.23007 Transcript_8516/m.23007 type:complete len:292 (-) Transcript_8516:903-1778(-)
MSAPTRSLSRNGPMGIPNPAMTLSTMYGSNPMSTSRQAACVYGKKTRLTAKPVQLPTTTGVFLILDEKAIVSSRTCGEVFDDRTISKSGMTCAGEKKWAPTIRSCACGTLAPMTSMSIVEVFVDRIACLGHAFSRSTKIFCFNPMSSITASITISTSLNSSYVVVPDSSAKAPSATSFRILPFLTLDIMFDFTRSSPPCMNFSLISLMMTRCPVSTQAVAIPEPMSPPPRTAIFFNVRGRNPLSVIPVTFFVARWAKKMCTSALWVSSDEARTKLSPSFLSPARPPCSNPC